MNLEELENYPALSTLLYGDGLPKECTCCGFFVAALSANPDATYYFECKLLDKEFEIKRAHPTHVVPLPCLPEHWHVRARLEMDDLISEAVINQNLATQTHAEKQQRIFEQVDRNFDGNIDIQMTQDDHTKSSTRFEGPGSLVSAMAFASQIIRARKIKDLPGPDRSEFDKIREAPVRDRAKRYTEFWERQL